MSSPSNLSPADLSHAMLLAILMDNGGSFEINASAFETDAIGGPDGAFHAVSMDPLPNGKLRLSAVPRPAGDAGGIQIG
ncbi:pRL2-19 [Kitasatospora sp. NPDC058478]|uniref:pRL2-19 n=1 Tax=unclassified Kitasatospora TaxID=2633591 RepID=UPI00364F9651